MKRILLFLAICGSLLSLAVEYPAQASTRFNTCQELNRRYSNGVAKNRASVKKTRARVSLSIYNANQHLDLNKNGVGCERGEASSVGQGTPTQPAVGSGRGNPFPLGTSALRPDGWEIQVVSSIPDATSQVLAENMFNDPPKPGYQFFITRVRATYRGANSTSFDGTFRLRAVSAAGSTYSTFNDSCGVIPDPISSNRAFNGGTVEGNICWAIPTTAANNLVMYDDSFLSKDSDIRFWALS